MNVLRTGSFIVLACFVAGCRDSASKNSPHAVSDGTKSTSVARVETVRPERKLLRRTCTQPGQVAAFEEAPIYARVPGYVDRVLIDIGDRVRGPRFDDQGRQAEPGQVLAELAVPELQDEQRQQQAAVVQAEAQIQQAAAAVRVAQASVMAAKARVREAEAAITRADAEAQRWRSEHERVVQLAANMAVTQKLADETKSQWQAAEAGRQEASARVESATAALAEAEASVDKSASDEGAARARHQVTQAELQHARTMLDYATLRAPFDGVVSQRNVNTGHFVSAGGGTAQQSLFVVVQADTVRVFLDVPETDAALVDVGDAVEIRVEALGSQPIHGQVARSSWSLNSTTRTLRTEADVPNADGRLRPGMYVRVTLIVEERANAIVVPMSAVVTDGEANYCIGIHGGKAARLRVQLGLRAGADVEVVSGLKGNEPLVRSGGGNLHDGEPVEATAAPLK